MLERDQLDRMSHLLARAPAWARLALTSADERMRLRGADELSAFLLRRLGDQETVPHKDQLSLPNIG